MPNHEFSDSKLHCIIQVSGYALAGMAQLFEMSYKDFRPFWHAIVDVTCSKDVYDYIESLAMKNGPLKCSAELEDKRAGDAYIPEMRRTFGPEGECVLLKVCGCSALVPNPFGDFPPLPDGFTE